MGQARAAHDRPRARRRGRAAVADPDPPHSDAPAGRHRRPGGELLPGGRQAPQHASRDPAPCRCHQCRGCGGQRRGADRRSADHPAERGPLPPPSAQRPSRISPTSTLPPRARRPPSRPRRRPRPSARVPARCSFRSAARTRSCASAAASRSSSNRRLSRRPSDDQGSPFNPLRHSRFRGRALRFRSASPALPAVMVGAGRPSTSLPSKGYIFVLLSHWSHAL